MTIAYAYGNFLIHDGQTYFTEGVDYSWVAVAAATTKIARLEGLKKTGETTDDRQITINLSVVAPDGTRAGLEAALDALAIALNQRQQQLVIHTDGRYFICDCLQIQAPIQAPAYAAVKLVFRAYQPYAMAAKKVLFQPANTLMLGSANPYTLTTNLSGGGSIYSRPTITITNISTLTLTNLSITNLTDNIALNILGLSLAQNDYVTIISDMTIPGNMGGTIIKNNVTTTLYDFTGIFPSLDIGPSQWQIQATSSGGAPNIQVQWAWIPRWLS